MKTIGIDEIIRMIELNEITVWQVSTADGDNRKVFDSLEDETLEGRKNRFRQVMELYPAGRLILNGKKSKNDTRGGFRFEFSTNAPETAQSIGNMPAAYTVQGITPDEVKQQIADAIAAHDRERRLQELEAENKELKKVVDNDSIGRILTKAEPLIQYFIGRMIPQRPSVAVAGIEREDNEDVVFETIGDIDEETTDRVQAAIELWQTGDEDFVEVLEFIADFAANNRKVKAGLITLDYASVKNMLLNK